MRADDHRAAVDGDAPHRRQRAIERRIREAKFGEVKDLANFEWKFNAPGTWRTLAAKVAPFQAATNSAATFWA